MKITLLLKLTILFSILIDAVGVSHAAERRSLVLHAGEVRVLEVLDVEQVAIGNEKVVMYRPIESGELILIGGEVGQSTLHVWQKGGRQRTYSVTVISPDISSSLRLAKFLAKDISGLAVQEKENKLIFTGNISVQQKDNFYSVLKQFESPISMVTFSSFEFRPVVRLDVTLLEVKQRAVRDLGINWDDAISGPILGVHKTFSKNDYFRVARDSGLNNGSTASDILDSVPNDKSFYSYGGITSILGSIINILEETGDAEVISSPKLMAKSGESASFLSGGEFPVAVVNNEGQLEVEFKQYGVKLDITPQVDQSGNINTFIFTELSSIDFANAVNGVPGLVSRKSETTINLKSGETYAISGLALAERSEQSSKVPLLGDIPYLGRLFRSDRKNSDTTELVVMVTPFIVTPESRPNQDLIDVGVGIKKGFDNFDWKTKILE